MLVRLKSINITYISAAFFTYSSSPASIICPGLLAVSESSAIEMRNSRPAWRSLVPIELMKEEIKSNSPSLRCSVMNVGRASSGV